jgi:hypothetical protein
VKGREGESVVHTMVTPSHTHRPVLAPAPAPTSPAMEEKEQDVKGSLPVTLLRHHARCHGSSRGREGRPEMAKRSISVDCQTHGHRHRHLLWPVIIQFSVRAELLVTFLCDDVTC